jgi:HD-GYP domain-containing protein (c-di-GMP phosphodiesterase class II)
VSDTANLPSDRASGVRLSEVVAALSFVSDFGLGQPMEHVLRACLLALRLADLSGADEQTRRETYWVTLLATVCTGESFELSRMFGDEVAFRSGVYHAGPSQLAQMVFVLRLAGSDRPDRSVGERARATAGILAGAGRSVEDRLLGHCALTRRIAERLSLDPGVAEALSNTFVRWDGKGVPRGVHSKDAPASVRFMCLADMTEVHHRLHGVDGAVEFAQSNSGMLFSPDLVGLFVRHAPDVLAGLGDATWDQVIDAEPLPRPALTEQEFDSALEVMADIADLKSPWFAGHSRGVADLAAAAAKAAGMPANDVITARRAGLLHDIGRTAVSNEIWDRPGPLSESDQERVRLHAYYTERMLRRPAALAGLSAVAASHHERLDGSGYHRAIRGSEIPLLGRYLAAADVYHALQEDRPHRPARTAKEAAAHLRTEVREGRLDGAAVEVVLSVSGHRTSGPPAAPAGLTPREVEVLLLVARGASTRHVARTLNITPKTAGNHIERIYSKIGASSRATATLFAMQHGMLATLEPVQR